MIQSMRLEPIPKQIAFKSFIIIVYPLNYKPWSFIGPYKENFPITTDVRLNKLKQIKV